VRRTIRKLRVPHFKREGESQYRRLSEYETMRQRELRELAEPFIHITDLYATLACRLAAILATVPSKGIQDHVARDLLADSFDFLYESRIVLLKGKADVAYPLIRRAYESISLMALCCLDAKYAQKWQAGEKIDNATVRKELGKHPMGESEKALKDLYSFFSLASHPNRGLISHRYLGGGNQFVFGSISLPNLPMIADYCMKHLNLWFWLGAISGFFYRETIVRLDPEYVDTYDRAASEVPRVIKWLSENYERTLQEYKDLMVEQPPPEPK
jgi:hypothetical protein